MHRINLHKANSKYLRYRELINQPGKKIAPTRSANADKMLRLYLPFPFIPYKYLNALFLSYSVCLRSHVVERNHNNG